LRAVFVFCVFFLNQKVRKTLIEMEQAVVFALGALITTHFAGKQLTAANLAQNQFGSKHDFKQQTLVPHRAGVDDRQVAQHLDQKTLQMVDVEKLAVMRYKSKYLSHRPVFSWYQSLANNQQTGQTIGQKLK